MSPLPSWVRAGVVLVVGLYVAYSLFGIACPVLWGHHGYHAATYMLRAVMTLRFHMITPASWAGYEFPPTFSWYFHHPIGYHHLLVPFVWLFGSQEWLARGFAAAWGLLTIHALFRLVRRWWSPEMALLAIAAFVAAPFITQFSVLLDAQFPAMACTLYALDCFLRYLETPERKWIVGACAAFVGAGLLMWDGYFQAFAHGLYALAILFTARGRKARLLVGGRATRLNASFAWVLFTGLFSALAMAFHFLLTWSKGRMSDFGGSYDLRHNASLDFIFQHEKQWMEILFGWPLVGLGALWIGVFVFRAVIGKARLRDQAVWIFFVTKTFYTAMFGEATAMHEYRVDWYLLFFILAGVDLVDDLHSLALYVLNQLPAVSAPVANAAAAFIALCAVTFYFYLDVPHAYKNLIDSRVRMGTDAVANYNADYAKQLFAMEAARRSGKDDFFFVHNNMPRRIEFYFYMDRSNLDIGSLSLVPSLLKQHPRALVLMDLLKQHPGFIYDHYILVDLRSNKPGLHEYQYQPMPMSPLYRYFVSHVYPPMKAVEAPTMVSGCLEADAGLVPPPGVPLPPEPSKAALAISPEQALCYYDLKRLVGDAKGAAVYRDQLLAAAGVVRNEKPLLIAGTGTGTGPGLGLQPEARHRRHTRRKRVRSAHASMGASMGQVIGLTPPARNGATLYWTVEKPEALPKNALVRWELRREPEKVRKPHRRPSRLPPKLSPIPSTMLSPMLSGETQLFMSRPGSLRSDRLSFHAVPGSYRLRVAITQAAPLPKVLGAADLGVIVIP